MEVKLEASWKNVLKAEFEKEYFAKLAEFVRTSYRRETVYPPPRQIFRAFDLCPFDQVKVVILGQDPYHGPGQANGLCFAVGGGVPPPPSLQNIFKEIESDLGRPTRVESGDLSSWSEQGVLLLNAILTVAAGRAGSHQGQGWEEFTDAAISTLAENRVGLVFLLWGNYAKSKGAFIDRAKHCVIESPHPSPFSARSGFFGSHPFSRANEYLAQTGQKPIEW